MSQGKPWTSLHAGDIPCKRGVMALICPRPTSHHPNDSSVSLLAPQKADLSEAPECCQRTGLRDSQSGVHQPAQGRLLSWNAVVVIVVCSSLILTPDGLLQPSQSGGTEQLRESTGPSLPSPNPAYQPGPPQVTLVTVTMTYGVGHGAPTTNSCALDPEPRKQQAASQTKTSHSPSRAQGGWQGLDEINENGGTQGTG